MDQYSRTRLLLGEDGIDRLKESRVAVFGVGGVGGYVAEALARSGVGTLILIDDDTVSLTNLNRQIIALHSTIGRDKVDVMAERIRDINPDLNVIPMKLFYTPETAEQVDLSACSYVVDAIDTVSGKLEIVRRCNELGVPVISAMGAGNKMDPSKLVICDLYSTSVCPLARVMRTECRKLGIPKLKVAYSTEPARKITESAEEAPKGRRSIPGSTAFVPSAMGLLIASEIVAELSGDREKHS